MRIIVLAALLLPAGVRAQDPGDEARTIVGQARALNEANSIPVVALHTMSSNDAAEADGAKDEAEKALGGECLAESSDGALIGAEIVIVDGHKAHAFQLCRRDDMKGDFLYELVSAKDAYLFRADRAKTNAKSALAGKCGEMGPEAGLVGKPFVVLDGFAANAVQACRFKKPG
ncbi:MAG: hypothetical protein ACHQ2Z_14905 [Elusimicrobiota bacterium]